jgi:hypothetical protein
MARRGLSEADKQARAVQAARRMISAGERPAYRLVELPDATYRVDGLPGLVVGPVSRRDARDAARAAIAAVLEMPADALDVET